MLTGSSQDSAHKVPSESKLFLFIFLVVIEDAQERQYLLHYMQKPYLSRREQHVQEHFRKSRKVCEICGKDFRGNYELKKHKNYKHVGASIRCPYKNCNKKYKSENGLKHHLCAKHKEKSTKKPLVCKNCSKSFFDKQTCDNHMELYHEKPRLTCRRCGAEFAYVSSHYHHEKVCLTKQDQHGEGAIFLWKDVSCGKKFRTIKGCREHFLSHHSNRNYMCESCGKSFKYRLSGTYHINFVCRK